MKIYILLFILILCPNISLIANNDTRPEKNYNITGLKELKNGNYKNAEKYFKLAISINPDIKYFYNNMAVTLMKQGKYTEASQYLEKCIIMDPGYVKALSNMAVASFNLLRFREAYNFYVKAESISPEYTRTRFKKKRVINYIKKLSYKYPYNSRLTKIIKSIEN